MATLTTSLVLASLLTAVATAQDPTQTPETPAAHWPQFRGPNARGIAADKPLPESWNLDTGENVLWRTKIPGLAHSSPVVWGDRIYLTTAVRDAEGEPPLKVGLYGSIAPVPDDSEHAMQVLCVDAVTGKVLWTKTAVTAVPKVKRHPKGSHAASTPATDGKHVVAFFGSEGLFCYDAKGELLWERDLGTLDSGFFRMPGAQWGFASSPILFDGKVYVQCDVQKGSFVACLDLETGKDVWRVDRKEVPTWGTPTVDVREGRRQLICNGWKHIGAYDLDNGKELWRLEGGGDIPVPTPVVSEDTVFITSSHGGRSPVLAIDAMAKGEFTMDPDESEQVRWATQREGAYMQTPLAYRGLLYVCKDIGSVSCFDMATGERFYRKRLGGFAGFTASPVAADGKLYWPGEDGEIFVVEAGKEFKLLQTNEMGEECMASPAIGDGVLYLRSRRHLVAVGAKQ